MTDKIKAGRVRVSRELLGCFEGEDEGFLQWIVRGEETWVHNYVPENKRQSKEYCQEGHERQKIQNQSICWKVMLTVFWNSEGVALTDFLEKSATVNSECYIETLKCLKKLTVREGAEIYDIWLQQDNARPHTSATITDAIAHLGFTVLPYLAYSLDLALSNFHLFPKLKEDLRGQNFSSDEEVKAAVCQWCWEIQKDYF